MHTIWHYVLCRSEDPEISDPAGSEAKISTDGLCYSWMINVWIGDAGSDDLPRQNLQNSRSPTTIPSVAVANLCFKETYIYSPLRQNLNQQSSSNFRHLGFVTDQILAKEHVSNCDGNARSCKKCSGTKIFLARSRPWHRRHFFYDVAPDWLLMWHQKEWASNQSWI